MIGFPTLKDFNVMFSEEFILDEVKEEFNPIYKPRAMGVKMTDYISSTCIGTNLMGFNLPSTNTQGFGRGKQRTFHGSIDENQQIKKEMDLAFTLRGGVLNYMILHRNIETFQQKVRKSSDDLFFPPIFLFLYDTNGTIMYVWEYQEIQIEGLPEINLRKDDMGGRNKEFTLKVKYNNIKFHSKIPKKFSDLNSSYKHQFE